MGELRPLRPDTPLSEVWTPPRLAPRVFHERRISDSELAELVRSRRSFYVTSAQIEDGHAWLRVEFPDSGDVGMMRLWAKAPRTLIERRGLVEALQGALAAGGRVGPCRLGKRPTRHGPALLDLEPAE